MNLEKKKLKDRRLSLVYKWFSLICQYHIKGSFSVVIALEVRNNGEDTIGGRKSYILFFMLEGINTLFLY